MARHIRYIPAGITLDVNFNTGRARDQSVSDTHGTISGSPVFTTGAYFTDGGTTSISFGNTANTVLGTGNFSIVSWVLPDADMSGVVYRAICGRGTTTAGQWYLSITSATGIPIFYSSPAGPTKNTDCRNAMHCICATKSGNDLIVYVDGAAGSTVTQAGLNLNSTTPFIVGDSMLRRFKGSIYRVMFWKGTALTARNISELYRQGPF